MRLPHLRRLFGSTLGLFVSVLLAQASLGQVIEGFEGSEPAVQSGDAGIVGSYQGQAPPSGSGQFLITTIRATDNEDGVPTQTGTDASTFATYNSTIFFGNAPAGGDGSGVLIPFTIDASGAIQLQITYDFL